MNRINSIVCAGAAFAVLSMFASAAAARPLAMASYADPQSIFGEVMAEPDPGIESQGEADPQFRRQIVSYRTGEAPGTIVIDTPNTYLYYVLGNGRAVRYGIGVGREGFTWSGVQKVSRKAEWPDWHPPAEMIARQPYLPRFMAGGPGNPLGARAMYLGNTVYRIHGTNAPETIGHRVSSGCIRLTNDDVADLYARVNVGTKVVVLPMSHGGVAANRTAPRRSADAAEPTYRSYAAEAPRVRAFGSIY